MVLSYQSICGLSVEQRSEHSRLHSIQPERQRLLTSVIRVLSGYNFVPAGHSRVLSGHNVLLAAGSMNIMRLVEAGFLLSQ